MGVWIETFIVLYFYSSQVTSHPMWVCGLKPDKCPQADTRGLSHPMWVCGLKHTDILCELQDRRVTPYVGVWIETSYSMPMSDLLQSHPMWVCGLKQHYFFTRRKVVSRHTLCGCVD